jgi:hypothetical protein
MRPDGIDYINSIYKNRPQQMINLPKEPKEMMNYTISNNPPAIIIILIIIILWTCMLNPHLISIHQNERQKRS